MLAELLSIIGLALWVALSSCPLALTHCCCCKAGMITDAFTYSGVSSDWEIRSGSWANTANYLETSSTGAVILRTETLGTLASNEVIIRCTIRAQPFASKVRVIFGWQDDSNFYAAEIFSALRYQPSGGGSGFGGWLTGNFGWVKIIQRIGGVESDASSESLAGFVDATKDWSVTLCYKESTDPAVYNAQVTFSEPGVGTVGDSKCHLEPLGRRFGFGTGGAVGTVVKFDDLVVDCPGACAFELPCNCLPLTAPNEVEVSLPGVAGLEGPILLTRGDSCHWLYVTPDVGGCIYNFLIRLATSGGAIKFDVFVGEYQTATGFAAGFLSVFTLVASVPGDCQGSGSGTLAMVTSPGRCRTLNGATINITARV